MLVYGDAERTATTEDGIAEIEEAVRGIDAAPGGIRKHDALVTALLAASALVQGVADAEFEARGEDARSPAQDAGMRLLLDFARAVRHSWHNDFDVGRRPGQDCLLPLKAIALPKAIRIKAAEGYAFYALYPEAYLQAARRLTRHASVRVIGIRGIGTGLAALVAAVVGDPAPVTLRPVGHPFRRRVQAGRDMSAEFAASRAAAVAIVDEGPGLSGSSFGAVADWLEAIGVERGRIHALPSHSGDLGPMASRSHRERWAVLPRHVVELDDLVLRTARASHKLESWVADLVGAPEAPLEDLSGGAWRRHVFPDERAWPAADIRQERRKLRIRTRTGLWLLKFAGLGPEASGKLKRAVALHEAGFTPRVLGHRHGFLVQRWIEGAVPVGLERIDRAGLVETVGRYLGFRARGLPAQDARGAALSELGRMARHNTQAALGGEAGRALEPWLSRLDRSEGLVRRVDTDNRMHAWEWLELPDGRYMKTDALDHSASHDLVGCQDIAWDVAGAAVELALSDRETAALCAGVTREAPLGCNPDLVALLRPCYLAFQIGAATLAAGALADCPEEVARLSRSADRYKAALQELLGVPVGHL